MRDEGAEAHNTESLEPGVPLEPLCFDNIQVTCVTDNDDPLHGSIVKLHDVGLPAKYSSIRERFPSASLVTVELALGQEQYKVGNYQVGRYTYARLCRHHTTCGDIHPFCPRCHRAYGIRSCEVSNDHCAYCQVMDARQIKGRKVMVSGTDVARWGELYHVMPGWVTCADDAEEYACLRNDYQYRTWEKGVVYHYDRTTPRGSVVSLFQNLYESVMKNEGVASSDYGCVFDWVTGARGRLQCKYRHELLRYSTAITDHRAPTGANGFTFDHRLALRSALTFALFERHVSIGEVAREVTETPPPLDLAVELVYVEGREPRLLKDVKYEERCEARRKLAREEKTKRENTIAAPNVQTVYRHTAAVGEATQSRKRKSFERIIDAWSTKKIMIQVPNISRQDSTAPVSYVTHEQHIPLCPVVNEVFNVFYRQFEIQNLVTEADTRIGSSAVHAFRAVRAPRAVLRVTPSIHAFIEQREAELRCELGRRQYRQEALFGAIPTTVELPVNPTPFVANGTGVGLQPAGYPQARLPGMDVEQLSAQRVVKVLDGELRYLETVARLLIHQQSVQECLSAALQKEVAALPGKHPNLEAISNAACELSVESAGPTVETFAYLVMLRRRALAGKKVTPAEYYKLLTGNGLLSTTLAGE